MHNSFSFYFWYFRVMKCYYGNVATVLMNHLKIRKTYFPKNLCGEFFSNFEKLFWTLKPIKLPIFIKFCKNDSEKFQIMQFSRSFCFASYRIFLSIRTEISVCSLPLCQILQIFTVNFHRYFRLNFKLWKLFEGTRSLNLHLREPVCSRVHAQSAAQAARAKKLFRATLRYIVWKFLFSLRFQMSKHLKWWKYGIFAAEQ